MTKRVLAGLLVAVLAFAAAGCSAGEDKIGEEIGEGIVGAAVGGDVEVDGDSVTISGDDGDVTIQGAEAELPEGFPDEFPMHDDVEVDSASSIASGEGSTFYVNLYSSKTPGELHDWYKAELEKEWSIESDVSATDGSDETYIMSVKKDQMEASLTIANDDSGSQLGIILTAK